MEETILNSLMSSDAFYSKAYSYLTEDLFKSAENSIIFDAIKNYSTEYQKRPSFKEIGLSIKNDPNLNHNLKTSTIETFKGITKDEKVSNIDFLLDKTEKWIQKQKLTDSVFKAADIIKEEREFNPIIEMFESALKKTFNNEIGLDYSNSEDQRFSYYKSKETFTPLGIESIDKAMGGGVRPASLFLFGGSSHSGKTMAKIYSTCNFLLKKENVLYISLEMPELEISKRIDANLLGVTINELGVIDNSTLKEKWENVKPNIGELIIKEYGAGSFNVLKLKALLDDLKSKKDFIPDAIVIDYLGLMTTHRASMQSNSYETLGKVAEDLHAISKEVHDSKGNKGIKVVSSTQLNRSAYNNSEAGMETVSESMKIMMTADVTVLLISSDQMRENNQQIWKFVKNRYTGDMRNHMVYTDFPRVQYSDASEEDSSNTCSELESISTDVDTGLDFGKLNF